MSKQYRHRSGISARSRAHISKAQHEGAFCKHPHRICMQDRLDSFDYCLDHILQDKNAPYKLCNFVSSKSGKKCARAAPKADKKDGYCRIHTRKAAVLRYKASLKPKNKDPAQQLLDELDYYVPGSTKKIPDAPVSTVGKLMDYASGSDSDQEITQLDQTYQGGYESDAESVDSEPEDALKYAEVYTAEEVALITRDKLIRLQSLYINQFKRLQHLMKEKRREFLFNLKKEIPVYGPNLGRISDSKEKRRIRRLRAVMSYRKRKGKCALLQRKSKDHRIKATSDYQGSAKERKLPVCSYGNPGSGTCENPCVPLVKFCMDHIFQEPRQVLYKRCSKASGVCDRPACPYQKGQTCLLHLDLPPYKACVGKLSRMQADKKPDISSLTAALARAGQSSGPEQMSLLHVLRPGSSTIAPRVPQKIVRMQTSTQGQETGAPSGPNSGASDTPPNTSDARPLPHGPNPAPGVGKDAAREEAHHPRRETEPRPTPVAPPSPSLKTAPPANTTGPGSQPSTSVQGPSGKPAASGAPPTPETTALTEVRVAPGREEPADGTPPPDVPKVFKSDAEPEVADATDPLIDVTGISNESTTSITDNESAT